MVFLFAFLLVSSVTIPVRGDYFGLAGEDCRTASDCKSSASCVVVQDSTISSTPCSSSATSCVCSPRTVCSASSMCPEGEACYQTTSGQRFCISCRRLSIFVGSGNQGSIDGYSNCKHFGLDFDQCRTTDMCKGTRICIVDGGTTACLSTSGQCQCRTPPSGIKECTDCTPCDSGESCFQINNEKKACASEALVLIRLPNRVVGEPCTTGRGSGGTTTSTSTPTAVPESTTPSPTATPESAPTVTPATQAPVTAAPVTDPTPSTNDSTPDTEAPVTTSPVTTLPEDTTTTNVALVPGVTTVAPPVTSDPGTSQPPVTTPPSSNEPCIALHHLNTLPETILVFGNKHRLAHVLCDPNHSCATPGHIVVFQGRPMRMARYCATAQGVTCSREQMLVNNPRMRAGLRVGSHTEGLQFTALSARYESVGEEMVMRALVSVGM